MDRGRIGFKGQGRSGAVRYRLNESRKRTSWGKRKGSRNPRDQERAESSEGGPRLRKLLYENAIRKPITLYAKFKRGEGIGEMALWLSACCSCRGPELVASAHIR